MGDISISYIVPDKITRLVSRTATEQYLKRNRALGLPIHNFCWEQLILRFNNPEWETIRNKTRCQWYSQTRSTSPIAPPLKSAPNDQPPTIIYIDNTNTPHQDSTLIPANRIPNLHHLDNTLKPTVNLSRHR